MANNKQRSGSLFPWKTLENFLSQKMAKNLEALATFKKILIVVRRNCLKVEQRFEGQNFKYNMVITYCRSKTRQKILQL